MGDVVTLPDRKPKKKLLTIEDIEIIGFLTKDNRDVFIDDPIAIVKIMAFISQNKIIVKEKVK